LFFAASFLELEGLLGSRFFGLPFATLDLGLTTVTAFWTERLVGFFIDFLAVVLVKADIRNVRFHE
jgi:hypothetical protein